MRTISAAHLPPELQSHEEHVVAESGSVRVVTPRLDPDTVSAICRALIAAHEQERVPVARIVRAVDAAAARLLDPMESARRDILDALHDISGFSPAMAAYMLDRAVQDWREPALDALIRAELGSDDAIDGFATRPDGTRCRAVAPPLALHILAGNVPGVGVTSLVRSLIVGSTVLAKPAAGEPVLTAAFARLLAEVDVHIGRRVAVAYWEGGDRALEAAALEHAGAVIHYGSADAIADLRARAPAHVSVVEHGPRVSIALVAGGAAADPQTARELASAVATFDQQGCVSPQAAWVIGSREQAHSLAQATAQALDILAHELPRGRIDPAEATAIREFRTRAEFAAIGGNDVSLWFGEGLAWSVVLDDEKTFEGTCLNRTLLVRYVPDIDTLIHVIRPAGHLLQTVGIAGFGADEITDIGARLAAAGATRITTLPRMPWPPPTWHHDGRGPLLELIRWVDVEF